MKTRTLIAGALCVAATLPAAAQGKAGQLVGTWRLISATQRLADGTTRPDPNVGPKGVGYLIYTATGQVCALLANPERPRWATEGQPTAIEARSIYGNMVAYCGTYSVNQKDKFVLHHIEIDLMPNRTGTDRKRFFSISRDRLTLRPAPPLPNGVTDWTITWERVRS